MHFLGLFFQFSIGLFQLHVLFKAKLRSKTNRPIELDVHNNSAGTHGYYLHSHVYHITDCLLAAFHTFNINTKLRTVVSSLIIWTTFRFSVTLTYNTYSSYVLIHFLKNIKKYRFNPIQQKMSYVFSLLWCTIKKIIIDMCTCTDKSRIYI